jgi:hypothetical protein
MAPALADHVRAWLMRPRIVHRLPGRLRLHVPGLKHVDPTERDWALVWREVLGGLPGFRSVEANLVTASVVICYDPEALREPELIAFLEDVDRLVLRHWVRLAATPRDALPETVRRLVAVVRSQVRRRPTPDHESGISRDAAI